MRNPIYMAVACAALAGCSTVPEVAKLELAPQIGAAIFGSMDNAKAGAIYVWNPYNSAAIVDGKGNRCVIAASGAKTFQTSSESGLKVEGLEKIIGSTTLDANQKSDLIEAFTKLSAADSDAAFLDVALFHLCIFDQNGTFGKEENGEMKPKGKPILDAYLSTVELATKRGK